MQTEVEAALNEAIANGPALAMVNSERNYKPSFLRMLL
jgi:hypothetical protein